MSASIEFIEKLVCSDQFCKYVLNPDQESVAYWNEFRRKNPDREEEIKQARQLVLLLGDDKEVEDADVGRRADYIWRRVRAKTKNSSTYRRKGYTNNSLIGYASRIAAVLLLLAVVSFIILDVHPEDVKENEYKSSNYFHRATEIGQKGSYYLPDGSHINLNSGSNLYYYENKETSTRELTLEGEAFLHVKKDPDKPFIVKTKHLSAMVLGTSFNVKAYSNDLDTKVALVTGKVKVTGIDSDTHILTPNQMAVFNRSNSRTEIMLFDPEKITCWKDNVLLFDEVGLNEIISTLSRWYGVKFVVSDNLIVKKELFDRKDYRGKYKDKSLETVLEAISFSYGFKYRIQGDEIMIN